VALDGFLPRKCTLSPFSFFRPIEGVLGSPLDDPRLPVQACPSGGIVLAEYSSESLTRKVRPTGSSLAVCSRVVRLGDQLP